MPSGGSTGASTGALATTEAVACFEKALETDPNCAIAHWGVAYAVGPNYNYPWELQDPAGKAAALARAP